MPSSKRICFVCSGNIVRSPLAEHLFRRMAEQAGVGRLYQVASAGTAVWKAGSSPDSRMRRVAASHGLEYDGSSRRFESRHLEDYDLILVMDLENWTSLMELARTREQRDKIHMLREFDPQGGQHAGVPDPYYGGVLGFEETYQIVARSLLGLLEALESKSDPNLKWGITLP
jgi:protein-tyrosine phosphatase